MSTPGSLCGDSLAEIRVAVVGSPLELRVYRRSPDDIFPGGMCATAARFTLPLHYSELLVNVVTKLGLAAADPRTDST
jgi:hypothetical protein